MFQKNEKMMPPAGEKNRTVAGFWQTLPPSGRLFFKFWGGVSVLALLAATGLQIAGHHHVSPPPAPPKAEKTVPQEPATTHVASSAPADDKAEGTVIPPREDIPVPPGVTPVQPPLPALLEPVPGEAGHNLPKIGADGLTPLKAYAAAAPSVPAGNARIAVLLDGFGLSEDLSRSALIILPPEVSFAIPAYAPARNFLLNGARRTGHEVFLALPMQPSTAPLDDEGPRALGYDHTTAVDRGNLEWALSRFDGYVGVTNAFSGLDGDAYAQSPDFRMVSRELNDRGLGYLNATPGATWTGPVPGANAALTLDTNADAAGIDGQLAHLADLAKASGRAIAVAGPMRSVLIQRLADWSHTLASRGITLVPVSSLFSAAPTIPKSASSMPAHSDALPPVTPPHPVQAAPGVMAVPLPVPPPPVVVPPSADNKPPAQ